MSNPTSTATPANPIIRPMERLRSRRSVCGLSRYTPAPIRGTPATRRPAVELVRCSSARARSNQGTANSTAAKARIQGQ